MGRYVSHLIEALKSNRSLNVFKLFGTLKVTGHYIFQQLKVMGCYIVQLLKKLKLKAVTFKK